MKITFPISNLFYLACFDIQTSMLMTLTDVGFCGGLSSFDDYDLPCVSVYNKGTGEYTDSGIVLDLLEKQSPRTQIVLFETAVVTFSYDDVVTFLRTLRFYSHFGLIESIEYENSFGELAYHSSFLSFTEFEKEISTMNTTNVPSFKIKLTVPLYFKNREISIDQNSVSYNILPSFEMNCLKDIF